MRARRRVVALGGVVGALALALAGVPGCRGGRDAPAGTPRVVVLGIDGMDHALLERLMRAGRMPHFQALAAAGTFRQLASSTPPQSPVAWANFVTGADPAVHGIYDFVHRDPRTLAPYLSTSRAHPPRLQLTLGDLQLPVTAGHVEQLRAGAPFWDWLARAGVPATIVKLPDNFPPDGGGRVRSLSGMGTPDLFGTYGTFQVFTDDPTLLGRELRGGLATRLDFGGRRVAHARLQGPPDPYSKRGQALTLPLAVVVDDTAAVALCRLGAEERLLKPGEWSGWVPVAFPTRLGTRVRGMVRLFVRSLRPRVVVYVSALHADPLHADLPIAAPPSYAVELADAVGRFHTLGMPEDTKALSAGVLTPDDFLRQALLILEESERLLFYELDHQRAGLLFFYFSTIDQASHVFWQALEPDAPAAARRHAAVLPDLYARLDRILGAVRARLGPETTLVVMSDHGFSSYAHKVNLNTWLAERGYLALRPAAERRSESLGHIDWSRTQAYGLGLNGLYLNLRGREREGVVEPAEREAILERLTRELEAQRDPASGARLVVRVTRPPVGPHGDRAPDLIVGYDRGYRVSDESAVGTVSATLVQPNRDAWSSDHCIDRDLVPGVLLVNRRLPAGGASLSDLAPTLLGLFGIARPAVMSGRDLRQPPPGGPAAAPP